MTTTLSIRIDRELKEDVEELLSDLGMNVTTAITCFFKKMRDVQAIPFPISRQRKAGRAYGGASKYSEAEEGRDGASAAAEIASVEYEVPNVETRAVLERDMAGLEPSYGPFKTTKEMLKAALAMED